MHPNTHSNDIDAKTVITDESSPSCTLYPGDPPSPKPNGVLTVSQNTPEGTDT